MRAVWSMWHAFALVVTLSATTFAQDSTASSCTPPCRRGFECIDGQCVSMCNPPCPVGYVCDPENLDCVLPAMPVQPVQPVVTPQATRSEPTRASGCRSDEIMIGGECEEKDDITSIGSMLFPFTTMLYGAASMYMAVGGIAWAYEGAIANDYWDYSRNEYVYDGTSYYTDDVSVGAVVPQSIGVLVFGGLNQLSKIRQRIALRQLEWQSSPGLFIAGLLTYAASIASGVVNIVAFNTDNVDMAHVTSIVNSGVLVTSLTVNIMAYCVQHGHLRHAVAEADKRQGQNGIEVTPYLSLARDGGRAGLRVAF